MKSEEIRKCFVSLVEKEGIKVTNFDVSEIIPSRVEVEVESCKQLLLDINKVILEIGVQDSLVGTILRDMSKLDIYFMLLVYRLYIKFDLEYLETGSNTEKYLIQLLDLLDTNKPLNFDVTYEVVIDENHNESLPIKQLSDKATPEELLGLLGTNKPLNFDVTYEVVVDENHNESLPIKQTPDGTTPEELLGMLGIKPIVEE